MKQNYRVTSELGFAPGSWIQVIPPFMTKQSAITNRSREAWLAGKLVACLFLFSVVWIDLDQHLYPQACQQCFTRLPRNPQKSPEIPKRNPESVRMGWIGLGHWQQRGVALLLPTEAPPQLTSHGRPWAVGSWTGVLSVGREQLRG